MTVCCSKSSKYHTFNDVLSFLDQCEIDYLEYQNENIRYLNRLPYLVMLYMILGMVALILIMLLFCYYE